MTVKAVAAPEPLAIDDEFAKSLGFEVLDKLKRCCAIGIATEFARASRDKIKRQLLDSSTGATPSSCPRVSSTRSSRRSGRR